MPRTNDNRKKKGNKKMKKDDDDDGGGHHDHRDGGGRLGDGGGRRQQRQQKHRKQPRIVEHITEESDEEIDEDEAFNSDDERKYGMFFQDKDEDDDDDDEDGDDEDDKKERKRKSSSTKSNSKNSRQNDIDDDGNSSDDEEEDEIEDRYDEDDEEEEGAEDSNDDDDDEEGDGGQYMLDLLEKLDSKGSDKTKKQHNEDQRATMTLASHVKESEFSSTIVPKANVTLDALMDELKDTKGYGTVQKTMKKIVMGGGKNGGAKVTSAPLPRIQAERIERTLHTEEQAKEISLWMDAVKDNRNAETLDFRNQSGQQYEMTSDQMIEKFKPTTDFEKQLHEALEEAGQIDEDAMIDAEDKELMNNGDEHDDDLGSNALTLEEYKHRRGQLSKMRALMFYHEQKRHHINKIKSKKYRKIRKRQRERIKEMEKDAELAENADLLQEMEEKEMVERMKERMTLAHKNTSKWAKRILKRGKNVDTDTRKALSMQLKRGDDLLKRMKGRGNESDDDDDDDDDDNENYAEMAKKVLADTEKDDDDDSSSGPGKKKKKENLGGLFSMSFMQKGLEKQRERAREEARNLLQELEEEENENRLLDSDDDDDDDKRKKNMMNTNNKVASKEEMKTVLKEGEMVATSLSFGNSNSISMSDGINIDILGGSDGSKNDKTKEQQEQQGQLKTSVISEHSVTFNTTNRASESKKKQKQQHQKTHSNAKVVESSHIDSSNKKKKNSSKHSNEEDEEVDENPWFDEDDTTSKQVDRKDYTNSQQSVVVDDSKKNKKRKKTGSPNTSSLSAAVNVTNAFEILQEEEQSSSHDTKRSKTTASDVGVKNDKETASPSPNKKKELVSLTQEELVQRAFAAPSEEEIDEEFAKEKAMVEERENDVSRKKKEVDMNKVSGWGSWFGEGAPPPRPPKKLSKRLRAPNKKETKRQREDEKKPNVIISAKRVKKTCNAYMIAQIPYPYTSREEYERSMMGGIGREWNVTSSHKDMTRPEIITRAGKIIQPLSKKLKQARPAAKF